MNPQTLKIEYPETGICVIKVNRPEALNALNLSVLRELEASVSQLEKDPKIRILILTGEGNKAFVAGADIAAMQSLDPKTAEEFSAVGQAAMNKIDQSSLVSIALINGFALGGGLELALACDMRLASQNAKMGLPEVSLGLIPGFGGTQRLTKLVGTGLALEIMLTGDMITAEEAHRIRLVNKICPQEQLMDLGLSLGRSIISRGPVAVREAKRVAKNGSSLNSIEGFRAEKLAFAELFGGKESKEGIGAFLEKRKPLF